MSVFELKKQRKKWNELRKKKCGERRCVHKQKQTPWMIFHFQSFALEYSLILFLNIFCCFYLPCSFFCSLPNRRDFFSWVSKENKLSTFFFFYFVLVEQLLIFFFSWQFLHILYIFSVILLLFFFCYQIFIPFEFQVVAKDFAPKMDEKKIIVLYALTIAGKFCYCVTINIYTNVLNTHRALQMHFPFIIAILSPPENIKWTLNGTVSLPIFIYDLFACALSFSTHFFYSIPLFRGFFLLA